MSSINYAKLIGRFPSDKRAIKRLRSLVESRRSASEFTFDRLLDELKPSSAETLALLLTALVQEGAASKLVRLQSRSGYAGIGDYSSIIDVPEEIHDPTTDTTFEVTPDDLKVVYRFPGA